MTMPKRDSHNVNARFGNAFGISSEEDRDMKGTTETEMMRRRRKMAMEGL